MIVLPIVPLAGAGPLKLGLAREPLRQAAHAAGLSPSSDHPESDYFADEAVQVDYDEAGRALFIGISSDSALVGATWRGTRVADTPAEEVFRMIAAGESGGVHDFDADGYLFPRQIVALWSADEQHDTIRRRAGGPPRRIWGQIGIGTPAYRAQVERTRGRDT
ncbi:hypothetical protein [Phreatobacter sp.]|uniref:hypothetical protein n=1 Tax=Phreatobacter sp. TaxID=1966341 RepID=UPI003F6F147B